MRPKSWSATVNGAVRSYGCRPRTIGSPEYSQAFPGGWGFWRLWGRNDIHIHTYIYIHIYIYIHKIIYTYIYTYCIIYNCFDVSCILQGTSGVVNSLKPDIPKQFDWNLPDISLRKIGFAGTAWRLTLAVQFKRVVSCSDRLQMGSEVEGRKMIKRDMTAGPEPCEWNAHQL